jgi:hypothetical protein
MNGRLPSGQLDYVHIENIIAQFVWLISHQSTVLLSKNKSATSNQPAVLFSQNKSASAISHQPNEQVDTYGMPYNRTMMMEHNL